MTVFPSTPDPGIVPFGVGSSHPSNPVPLVVPLFAHRAPSATTGISFHSQTVTVLRAASTADRYGDLTTDWSSPGQIDVGNCRVLPMAGAEVIVDRDQIVRRWLLFAPPSADIIETDRVRVNGRDYEIDGTVRRWLSPSGRLAHLEADLKLVEG